MNQRDRSKTGMQHAFQPSATGGGHRSFQPIVTNRLVPGAPQPKPSPTAPPVYRPQPTPMVLQRKTVQGQPKSRSLKTNPSPPKAPAIYRPQPLPKVLQRRSAPVQPNSGNAKLKPSAPKAPSIYRPQPAPNVLQARIAGPQERKSQSRNNPARPPAYRPLPLPKVLQRGKANLHQVPAEGSHHRQAPTSYGAQPKTIMQPGAGVRVPPRNRQVAAPLSRRTLIQRKATFMMFGMEQTNPATYVRIAFRDNSDAVKNILPADSLLFSQIKASLASLQNDLTDHGTFDLENAMDVKRLAQLFAEREIKTSSNSPSEVQNQPSPLQVNEVKADIVIENPQSQSSSSVPTQKHLNQFTIVPAKSKDQVLSILDEWEIYFAKKNTNLSAERKNLPQYQNFKNSGTMIDAARTTINEKNDDNIPTIVRLAINPKDQAVRVAAVLIYSSKPSGKRPGYVADVLAAPKSLKPPKQEGKTGSELVMKGGGRALLENAVFESSSAGIKLWPLDASARAQYLKMAWGAARFLPDPSESGPDNARHLILKPDDIRVFAQHTNGLLDGTIKQWLENYK